MAPLWQDEDEPQWGADTPEEPLAQEAPAAEAGAEKKEGEEAPLDEAAAAAAAQAAADEEEMRKYNRHWVRPKFLQYSYLYDYRRNYYDDVIDYLDRRSHGINREIPRPQTWAERVLRTYNQKLGTTATAQKAKTDDQLIHSLHHVSALHHYHSKSYYHKVFTIAY